MMRLAFGLAAAAMASPAAAHDVSSVASAWTYDSWVIAMLYGLAILYLVGSFRLGSRVGSGDRVRLRQRAAFWSGWTALALALISPLHWLGERLFTAHMIEHTAIVAVATPLMACARPTAELLWAMPHGTRIRIARGMRHPAVVDGWAIAASPLVATAAHGAILWLWHLPAAYDLVITHIAIHRMQHLGFAVTGLVFWWSLLRSGRDGLAVLCLFASFMHTGLLGLILTIAGRPLYPEQTALASQFGLTPLEDQQLAGLVMWVPMGIIYAAAALCFAARWIARSSHGPRYAVIRAALG
jgi:putative membrane protein